MTSTSDEESGLSPKLQKLREKHRSLRRNSIQQLELSKTALERRSSGDHHAERRNSGGDQTVDTASSNSMLSTSSTTSVRVANLSQHEQLPVMEEASGSKESTSVSSASQEAITDISQQASGSAAPNKFLVGQTETGQEDSTPRLERIGSKHSQESKVKQTPMPTRIARNFSDSSVDSDRLKQLRNKHRSLLRESMYKLELTKNSLDRSFSADADADADADTSDSIVTSHTPTRLPQHEDMTLEAEIEDLREQIGALVISRAVARKEYLAQAETIRKLRASIHTSPGGSASEQILQRMLEISRQREILQKFVQDDRQLQKEQQQAFERLCDKLSQAQQQLEVAKEELKNQDHQDWLISWTQSTGSEAKHLCNMLGGLESPDQESQKRLQTLRKWLDAWAQVTQEITDHKNTKNANDTSTDGSATTTTKLVRQLSRKLGPNELDVLKEETAEVLEKLQTLRSQLDSANDEDEIHDLEEQIEEQLELWKALEDHMDELMRSESPRHDDKDSSPTNGSSPPSSDNDMTQSVEKLQTLLQEMQRMASSRTVDIHQESEGQSQFSESTSLIYGSRMLRISPTSSSSSWTPSSALTLLLSMRQQHALMEGIQNQNSHIVQLQAEEQKLKSQLELAQEQTTSGTEKHQGVLVEGSAEVDNEDQSLAVKLSMAEKQVQELQAENAALLSKIQEYEQREKVREQDSRAQATSSGRDSRKKDNKEMTEDERNKRAYDTAQAYFASKQEKKREEEEEEHQGLELSVRQMNLSMSVVSTSPMRTSVHSSLRSSSILEEVEHPSNRRQSRLLSRHVIGKNESGARKPLIFVDETDVERAQQVQEEALNTKLKRFLGINW